MYGKRIKALEEDVKQLRSEFERMKLELTKAFTLIGERFGMVDAVLYKILTGQPFSATLTFEGDLGMPAQIAVGGKGAQAKFTEFDGLNGSGNVAQPVSAVSFASDNVAVATVDPVSGAVVAVAPGTANISGSDAGDGLSASDVITVVAGAPQSATLVLTAN